MEHLHLGLIGAAVIGGALTVGVARADWEGAALRSVRAHADGSLSLGLSEQLETECSIKNAVRVAADERNRSVVDLIYTAYANRRLVKLHLAEGCSATGHPFVESVEVSNRTPTTQILGDRW